MADRRLRSTYSPVVQEDPATRQSRAVQTRSSTNMPRSPLIEQFRDYAKHRYRSQIPEAPSGSPRVTLRVTRKASY